MNDRDAVTIPKASQRFGNEEETHHDQHVLLADVTLVAERRGRDGPGRGVILRRERERRSAVGVPPGQTERVGAIAGRWTLVPTTRHPTVIGG